MKQDLFWTDILTRIARDGALDYNQLKRLDVKEFFLFVVNYEKNEK